MKTFRPFKIKKYKPFKLKIRKKPTYKPIRFKKPKPYKRGRLLKSGITQHMRELHVQVDVIGRLLLQK